MRVEIKNWLNTQHPFIQEAAYRLLIKGHLDKEDIVDLITIIKTHDINNAILPRDYPNIGRISKTCDVVRLVSIGEIMGIESLAPRKLLKFDKGNLSVIYGNNGSGKSGYVRILKKVCGKVGAKDLKPNVFKPMPDQRQCIIAYDINGVRKIVQWIANSDPIPELQDVDIFDSMSGRIYIESESEPSYIPAELELFFELVNTCKKIAQVLDFEKSKLVKKLPEIPRNILDTETGKIYSNLSNNIEKSRLDAIIIWTDKDLNEITDLSERLKAIDPAAAAKKLREVKFQIDNIISTLQSALSSVESVKCNNMINLRKLANDKRKSANEGARAISTSSKLEGIGSDTWRALWAAARDYSTKDAYTDKPFPNIEENALCVLCHQHLDSEARNRLNTFEAFVISVLQTEAENAEQSLEASLEELPIIPDATYLATACKAAELSDENFKKIEIAWSEVNRVILELKTATLINEIKKINIISYGVIDELSNLSNAAETKACQYDEDSKSINRQSLTSKVFELKSREWASQQSIAIKNEIYRLKQVCIYDDWLKLTNTTGISKKAGEFSELLITDSYVNRFNLELQKLGAKNISVELVKTRIDHGRSKVQIRLKCFKENAFKADEILSEGEKRIVTLAAFLADVTGKSTNTPFIFDDPISSLDQGYEEKTINRLIELSNDRQVLIFTHRLSFFGIISERATPESIFLRRELWGTGEPSEIPFFAKNPEKALSNLKNERLIKAKKTLYTEGNEAYYPLAKAICSDIRILMERIVETVFLADVVQRHRREVHTKGKIINLSKIKKEDCTLVDEIMTKYSCFEHSQSSDAPVEIPLPEELEDDIEKILVWHDEFKGRKP